MTRKEEEFFFLQANLPHPVGASYASVYGASVSLVVMVWILEGIFHLMLSMNLSLLKNLPQIGLHNGS